MKKITILLFIFFTINGLAQNVDLQSDYYENSSFGGYFSFDTKFSKMHGDMLTYTGVKFGIIINNKYAIGLAGYDISGKNTFDYRNSLNETYNFKNEISYGGLILEYAFFPELPVHITTPLLIGGGRISIKENKSYNQYESNNTNKHHNNDWEVVEESDFVVLEPAINLEVNLLKWMRLGLGTSYRFVAGSNLYSLPRADNNLSGFSFDMTLKLGCF